MEDAHMDRELGSSPTHHGKAGAGSASFLHGDLGFANLIDDIPGGIAVFHPEEGHLSLDYANEVWFGIHHAGEDREAYLGIGASKVIVEADRESIQAEFQRVALSDDEMGSIAYRVIGCDGEPHWVNMQFKYAYTEAGRRYYYGCYSDLDELKHAEGELDENREVLRDMIAYSDVQFFTYFPLEQRCEIYQLSDRFSLLPQSWDDFPTTFLEYAETPPEDAESYCDMVRKIDEGADEAGCTVRFRYRGAWIWERIWLRVAHRDAEGRTVRAQGYSVNVTERKTAEEKLQEERVRLKSLEGNVFEAFSFNLTKNSQPNIQTSDTAMLEGDVSDDIMQEALRISPALDRTNTETREILLRAAQRIPDSEDRELFISTCSGASMRNAVKKGSFSTQISYRRYVGDVVRWVATTTEVLPDPESGDLIAFFYTRDINDEMVSGIVSKRIIDTNYQTVTLWDLQTNMVHIKAARDKSFDNTNDVPFETAVGFICNNLIVDEEVDEFRKNFTRVHIISELEKDSVFTTYHTMRETDSSLPDNPHARMKNDSFYLDEHKDIIVMLRSDVTAVFEQERDTREKMAQALLAAEQASVAKTEFLSRMSHEIRTPMNAIIGLDAIALQEENLSTSMEDHLQKIGISARFLLSLINDILDMSRIESGRMMLKNEKFNFEELITSINTILYEQCRDSGLEYECVLKSFTEETYVGDATKLQQVLVNVLGNAVKFTPAGGKIHLMIEQVSRTKNRARLRFEIADTGIGIEERFIPHLFEPFSQEARGRTSAYGGSGLGLAISHSIVALMGGDITVHSIKNVGSEFTIEVEMGLTEQTIRRRASLNTHLTHLSTLIVDDDVIVCQHTQMILHEAGFKAEWVDSGAAAVNMITERHTASSDFDLVLLDWQMPDMDGIETARQIRAIVGPDVTIIIMTAYDWTDIEKKARAAGVDMFMKKPVFASSVTKAFESVFMRKRDEDVQENEPHFDFSGRRVLLVEDNELNAEIASTILAMKGCAVDTASNGAEAVESFVSAETGYYDAILMDVRMPVMDGLEATRAIRAMRKADSKTVPIIAMTANAFQEDVNQSMDAGMNAHLAKPIEPPTLYDTLERFFTKA